MKRLVAALCGLLAGLPAYAADDWSITGATDVRFFTWSSDRGFPANGSTAAGSGEQLYVPFAVKIVGQPDGDFKYEMLARGGWVRARQSTPGLVGEVETLTDTVFTATVSYLGTPGFQPFASLNLNLPTGESALFGAAANARMDADLVGVASYGEGFNIGPTAGFTIPISADLVVTASVGRTWRGDYERESSLGSTAGGAQALTFIDPGGVLTLTAAVAHKLGALSSRLTGSLSFENDTAENGSPLYDPGDRYVLSGSWSYAWPEDGVTTLTSSASHTERNDVLFLGATALVEEPFNTNSDIFKVGLQHLFAHDRLAIGPLGSYLFRDDNGYAPGTLQFAPEKERWAAGALARYALADHATLNARVEHVWTHQDPRPATGGTMFSVLANGPVTSPAVPAVSSEGWQVVFGANIVW